MGNLSQCNKRISFLRYGSLREQRKLKVTVLHEFVFEKQLLINEITRIQSAAETVMPLAQNSFVAIFSATQFLLVFIF